ncbi:hypothetical protein [Saliterribacillus persicus]|uniref:Lipoprotein n=1 Tax=Saliterribacillus persicus TaxID=930114 RepID=A0A368X830_9BACI|nr:hypothetical protein [Saliterribacillus persicus]RCW63356.1 hypothetical protein DFR57_11823 [Saliterribacillus persicus]
MGVSTINKSFLLFLLAIASLIFVASCGVADGGKVTAKDVLKQNNDADIIQFDGFIFNNVTNLDWFKDDKEEISFSKEHFIGEIKKQTTSVFGFSDLNATKLPKGTKVYSVDEKDKGMLFVEYEGEILYYMKLLEG